MVDTLLTYLKVELLLFPVTHYFIIISCVRDYSPFTSVHTPTTQYLFVPLYPCSVVVLFCCHAHVYNTLYTSSNNSSSIL